MSWNITPLDSIDLSSYSVLPFGRFNDAIPFLSDFLNSDAVKSDLVAFDTANLGALKRAAFKASKLDYIVKDTGKKTKKGKKIETKTFDATMLDKALNSLGITIETLASKNADGKLEREFIFLTRISA